MVASSSQQYGVSAPGERNITRTVAGMVWKDKTLLDWPEDDFRVFIGDLGNEVNDDVLTHAFQRYPSLPDGARDQGQGLRQDERIRLRELQGPMGHDEVRCGRCRASMSATGRAKYESRPRRSGRLLEDERQCGAILARAGRRRQVDGEGARAGGAIQKKKIHKNKNKHLPW